MFIFAQASAASLQRTADGFSFIWMRIHFHKAHQFFLIIFLWRHQWTYQGAPWSVQMNDFTYTLFIKRTAQRSSLVSQNVRNKPLKLGMHRTSWLINLSHWFAIIIWPCAWMNVVNKLCTRPRLHTASEMCTCTTVAWTQTRLLRLWLHIHRDNFKFYALSAS